MDLTLALGWLAAALVLTSFYLRTITALRLVASGSNLAFIAYALAIGATPILVLHCLLLPLNVFRLAQTIRLKKRVQAAFGRDAGRELVLPYMNRLALPAGAVLFEKGMPSDRIFYVIEGMVELIEKCETRCRGEMLGHLSIFNMGGTRLDTAVTSTPVQLGVMTAAEVERALNDDPAFARFFLRNLADMSHERAKRHARFGAAPSTVA